MDMELFEQYKSLVYALSNKFYGAEKEDLIQAGFLGLAKAKKNFDESAGTKFSTYAYEYIYGEMYEMANKSKPIRVRKDLMKIYKSVMKTKELLTQKYAREVSYEEVTQFLGVDFNLFLDILNSINASLSIDYTEVNLTQKEYIDDLLLLKESLEKLSATEKNVIGMRYFNDLSQDETAKILGLSQVSVSRIEKSGKQKIKEFINN